MLLVLPCCVSSTRRGDNMPSGDRLRSAYSEGIITLSPPLSQYAGLHLNLDKQLALRPDFFGLRVDLNAPKLKPRIVGSHPCGITYFFLTEIALLKGLILMDTFYQGVLTLPLPNLRSAWIQKYRSKPRNVRVKHPKLATAYGLSVATNEPTHQPSAGEAEVRAS
jgi:hypothetical protein